MAIAFFGLYVLILVLGFLVWAGVVTARTGLALLAAAALVAFARHAVARWFRRGSADP